MASLQVKEPLDNGCCSVQNIFMPQCKNVRKKLG
jgi:hypothetical protein